MAWPLLERAEMLPRFGAVARPACVLGALFGSILAACAEEAARSAADGGDVYGGGTSMGGDAGTAPAADEDAGSGGANTPAEDSGGSGGGGGAPDSGWSTDAGLPTGPAYYVATDGSDSNAGTDVAHPFLTIGKAASVVKAGDTVVIRAGVYRETVTLGSSGSAASPITFESYPGETVTVSGADVIPATAWTVHSGSIHRTAMPWTLGVGMDQIFVDGVMMNEARWPNTTLDVSHPKTSSIGSVSGTTTLTMSDAALTQAAGFWNGAHVNMGSGASWIYEGYEVTSSSPGHLVFSANTSNPNYAPIAGNIYYLWGILGALDAGGEWFNDAAAKTLYLWTPSGDDPAGHVVEAKRRAYAFDVGAQSDIVLRGLRIFGATVTMNDKSHDNVIDGVAARYVSHAMVLNGSYVANSSTTGFLIAGTHHTLENSAVSFSSGNGVNLSGTGHTVSNCLIHDVDYVTSDCAAISPSGSNATIANNTLYNGGRSLLLFKIPSSKATHNLIYGAGLQADDLAGIYTYGTDGVQSEIAYNVVHTIRPQHKHKGMAIYLDNGSSNYVVHHNLGYDLSDDGMIINTVSTNNLIYNNTYAGGIHGGGTDPGVQIINNIFTGAIKIGTGATVKNNVVGPTDPLFVDADGGDYQLQPGSPAIDTGASLPPYTNGHVGSAPDLGAFERGAPPWSAGSSLTSDGF